MKTTRYITALLACAMMTVTALAQSYTTHLLVHTGEPTPVAVQVVDGLEVKMADHTLTVSSPLSSISYDLSDVKRMEYALSPEVGVKVDETLVARRAAIVIDHGSITVVTPAPGLLRIISLSGETVICQKIADRFDINCATLTAGVYFITLDGVTLGRIISGK